MYVWKILILIQRRKKKIAGSCKIKPLKRPKYERVGNRTTKEINWPRESNRESFLRGWKAWFRAELIKIRYTFMVTNKSRPANLTSGGARSWFGHKKPARPLITLNTPCIRLVTGKNTPRVGLCWQNGKQLSKNKGYWVIKRALGGLGFGRGGDVGGELAESGRTLLPRVSDDCISRFAARKILDYQLGCWCLEFWY